MPAPFEIISARGKTIDGHSADNDSAVKGDPIKAA
jgi:hypothetical protein